MAFLGQYKAARKDAWSTGRLFIHVPTRFKGHFWGSKCSINTLEHLS